MNRLKIIRWKLENIPVALIEPFNIKLLSVRNHDSLIERDLERMLENVKTECLESENYYEKTLTQYGNDIDDSE